jgi:hypothetical protein
MDVELHGLSEADSYALFSQIIIPRPIAWVLSDNGVDHGSERWNLAPFSYFNGIIYSRNYFTNSHGIKKSLGQIHYVCIISKD